MAEERNRRTDTKLVVMGVITNAHGIRGEVKIKSFTEVPEDIAAYGPLLLDDGPRTVEILRVRPAKGLLIAKIAGVTDRNAAELLKGRKLKLPRERLPEPEDEDEFYHTDLIGLKAEDASGKPVGTVVAVQNFGASDLLEIRPAGGGATFYLAFTRENVPVVDIEGGRVVVNVPEEDEEPVKLSEPAPRRKNKGRKKAGTAPANAKAQSGAAEAGEARAADEKGQDGIS